MPTFIDHHQGLTLTLVQARHAHCFQSFKGLFLELDGLGSATMLAEALYASCRPTKYVR